VLLGPSWPRRADRISPDPGLLSVQKNKGDHRKSNPRTTLWAPTR